MYNNNNGPYPDHVDTPRHTQQKQGTQVMNIHLPEILKYINVVYTHKHT